MKLGPVKKGKGDYLKCSIPDSIICLPDPFPKFPKASRIVMDNSLPFSSALYASGPLAIK